VLLIAFLLIGRVIARGKPRHPPQVRLVVRSPMGVREVSSRRRRVVLLVCCATCLTITSAGWALMRSSMAATPRDEPKTIRATFSTRSSAAGDLAVLTIRSPVPQVTLQVFHAGPERSRATRPDVMTGVPVSRQRRLNVTGTAHVRVPIGNWRSGLYFARLEAPGGYLGFAPLVVRPRVLGESRVAVVVPTNTWEAYNFRDVDGDGVGDTWYAEPHIPCVDLQRPYLDRGVPSVRFRGFTRWFEHGHRMADFLSDDDLDRIANGEQLAHLYDLVLFASHEEYVTTHAYDLVVRYRNLGGNLAFLSANTFFYRVERHGHRICRTGRWIDLGRVEARLTGVQYIGYWENRYPSRPYVSRAVSRAPWFFHGSGLSNGDSFGARYGVEVDTMTKESPPGTILLADIRDIFGPRRTASMTYYESPSGAKVFSAGAFGFESPQTSIHRILLDNLWAKLVQP
jgi:hypothetical protein